MQAGAEAQRLPGCGGVPHTPFFPTGAEQPSGMRSGKPCKITVAMYYAEPIKR